MNHDKRTNDELNRIIAEWCGWRTNELGWWACDTYSQPKVPNYCRDLNACHEAEKQLQNQFNTVEEQYWRSLSYVQPHPIYATARQRAEALVRVIESQQPSKQKNE